MRLACALFLLASCHDEWGGHRQAGLCAGAIAGRTAWPKDACRAMHMCANEALLTPAEQAKLTAQSAAAGCAPF